MITLYRLLFSSLLFLFSFSSWSQGVVSRTTGTNTPLDARLMTSKNLYIPRVDCGGSLQGGVDTLGAIVYSICDSSIYVYNKGGNWTRQIRPVDLSAYLPAAITSPSTNQLIHYNGSAWVNYAPTYISGNQTITISGDASGSGTTAITLTLASVNTSPGTYGAASKSLTATVDAKGRITGLSEQAIQITIAQVTSLQPALDAKLNLSGGTITGPILYAGTPSNANELINKNYADNLFTGVVWKTAVRAATTANITLSGTQTVDLIALSAGDRVLVKNQTDQTQNGIYVVASGAWTRASDADVAGEILSSSVYVTPNAVPNTNTNGGTQWTNSNSAITLGSTNITFSQTAGQGTYTNGTGLSLTGNVFSITNTAVTPGTAGDASHSPNITVNAQGQITNLGQTLITPSAIGALPVTLSSPAISQYIRYNGSAWVNATIAEGDITNLPSDLGNKLNLSGGTLTGGLSGTTGTFSGVLAGLSLKAEGSGTDGGALQLKNGTTSPSVSGSYTYIFQNAANTLKVLDNATSKSFVFNYGSIASTQTYTFPNASGTFALIDAAQTWVSAQTFSNLTTFGSTITVNGAVNIKSANYLVLWNAANTGNVLFRASAASVLSRSIELPDLDGTVTLTGAGQSVSFGTITNTTGGIDLKANGGLRLWDAGNSGWATMGYDGTNFTFNHGLSTTTGNFSSTITGVNVSMRQNGSNTAGLGPYYQWGNVAGSIYWLAQLNASNNIDFQYFNGSSWSVKQTFGNDGSIATGNATITTATNSAVIINTTGALNSYSASTIYQRSGVTKFYAGLGSWSGSDNYEIASASTLLYTLTSAGQVGIGTSAPSNFYVSNLVVGSGSGNQGITVYGGTYSTLAFASGTGNSDGGTSNRGKIYYDISADALKFSAGGAPFSTPSLTINSNQSVDFKANVWHTGNGVNRFYFAGATTYFGTPGAFEFQGPLSSAIVTISSTGVITSAALGTGTVYSNAGTLTNTNPSDERLKTNITPLHYGLNEIMQIKTYEGYYKSDLIDKRFFEIAQQVQKIMPELVRPISKDSKYLGIKSEDLNVVLIKSVQELKAITDHQQKQIDSLRKAISKFKKI